MTCVISNTPLLFISCVSLTFKRDSLVIYNQQSVCFCAHLSYWWEGLDKAGCVCNAPFGRAPWETTGNMMKHHSRRNRINSSLTFDSRMLCSKSPAWKAGTNNAVFERTCLESRPVSYRGSHLQGVPQFFVQSRHFKAADTRLCDQELEQVLLF